MSFSRDDAFGDDSEQSLAQRIRPEANRRVGNFLHFRLTRIIEITIKIAKNLPMGVKEVPRGIVQGVVVGRHGVPHPVGCHRPLQFQGLPWREGKRAHMV